MAEPESNDERRALVQAITKLQPYWVGLPIGPYPPLSDNTSFPRTGSPGLTVSQASVTREQQLEPVRQAAAITAEARARRPQLTGVFWIGLACGAAAVLLRNR